MDAGDLIKVVVDAVGGVVEGSTTGKGILIGFTVIVVVLLIIGLIVYFV